MANEFIDIRWIVDSTGVLTTERQYVKRVRWDATGVTAGTSRVIIHDNAGKVLWETRATGTTVVESDLIEEWWNGININTIADGLVIIELE